MEKGEEVRNKHVIFRDYIEGYPKESDLVIRTENTIHLEEIVKFSHEEAKLQTNIAIQPLGCSTIVRTDLEVRKETLNLLRWYATSPATPAQPLSHFIAKQGPKRVKRGSGEEPLFVL
ncbi:hypothetical protein RHMOL_Rhmol06G0129600 [Rhododendron molle]|uniref:Uncharacterized protein n=1 Tax=Rhododendron molle TaxID=49168 RepID=A0ACC0NBV7_RHOML|nr:hypothetical protein RHMOL_Rhmol06G0129600 [Rhododendron molle]